MEYLVTEVQKGNLVLHCPSCKKIDWQLSRLYKELLHCNTCLGNTKLVDWVSLIKRKGDGSPNTFLSIEMGVSLDDDDDIPSGYYICVDTSGELDINIEDVRFCTGNAGGRSLSVYNKVIEIGNRSKQSDGRIWTHYESEGGTLKIYQGIGDADIHMKTLRDQDGVFHGASVYFPLEHAFSTFVPPLIQAILIDMKVRPIDRR